MSLETTVRHWLTKDEQLEFLIEEKIWPKRKCMVITSARAILFNVNMFRRMSDASDKQWRQLIDVHLKEYFIRADLTLAFFRYYDSLIYHSSHDAEKNGHAPDIPWTLKYLKRNQAKEAYRILKEKEHKWKEIRLKEHLEHDRAMSERYLQIPRVEGNENKFGSYENKENT